MKIEATYCTPKEGRDLKILGSGKLLKVAELCNGRKLRAWGKTESEGSGPKRIGSYVGPMDCQGETLRLELELEDSENLAMLFFWCSNLVTIDFWGLGGLLPNSVKAMFAGCSSLESVPSFDLREVTDFAAMFLDCESLKEAPKLNTSNGRDFSAMFSGCSRLESVPAMETENGEDFNSMFAYCQRLKEAPRLDTRNGRNTAFMFYGCQALEKLPMLDLGKSSDQEKMFAGCGSLGLCR